MTASPAPLRIALVGCGAIAPTQAGALRSLPELASLVAVCDRQRERADAMGDEYGVAARDFAAILADPEVDAVTVCTPSGAHAGVAIMAMEAGKHVLVEKPMEVSVAACQQMLDVQRRHEVRLAVVSQHRFDPASERVRQALDEGALGPLVALDMRVPWFRTQEYYDSGDWRGTLDMEGGGCLINQGIHTLDLLRWMGGPVTAVTARMATAAHERIEVEDIIVGTLEFASGALGSLLASTATYPGFPARLAVYGRDGAAVIEGDGLKILEARGRQSIDAAGPTAHALKVATGGTQAASSGGSAFEEDPWAWGDAHRAQLRDFVEACREGRAPRVDGEAGLEAVRLIRALYESARTGQEVRLD